MVGSFASDINNEQKEWETGRDKLLITSAATHLNTLHGAALLKQEKQLNGMANNFTLMQQQMQQNNRGTINAVIQQVE
eukprot:1068026-Pyramimonas_sp.AAC.1